MKLPIWFWAGSAYVAGMILFTAADAATRLLQMWFVGTRKSMFWEWAPWREPVWRTVLAEFVGRKLIPDPKVVMDEYEYAPRAERFESRTEKQQRVLRELEAEVDRIKKQLDDPTRTKAQLDEFKKLLDNPTTTSSSKDVFADDPHTRKFELEIRLRRLQKEFDKQRKRGRAALDARVIGPDLQWQVWYWVTMMYFLKRFSPAEDKGQSYVTTLRWLLSALSSAGWMVIFVGIVFRSLHSQAHVSWTGLIVGLVAIFIGTAAPLKFELLTSKFSGGMVHPILIGSMVREMKEQSRKPEQSKSECSSPTTPHD
jgi:hypothetical protein